MMEKTMHESNLKKLHTEWLNSIEACLGQLQNIDSVTRHQQTLVRDVAHQSDLSELRYRIFARRNALVLIANEVIEFEKKLEARPDKQIISMPDVMANNRLRDKVIKAEQSVFTLKHEVAQLLSRAS